MVDGVLHFLHQTEVANQQIYFQYDYPSAADIVTEQRNYIKQYINNFEGTLNEFHI